MAAGKLDLVIEQGSTFARTISWADSAGTTVPLDGYSARMQIRRRKNSTSTIIELNAANGRATVDEDADTISLLISATDTAALDFSHGVYDLEVESGSGVVTRLLEGEVELSKEVTR